MKTTTMSDRDALELANGRVPARPDLNELADLLTAYRSAAIGSAPRPSAGLSARLDLTATPIAMQRDAVTERSAGVNTRRAASGLLGLGATVAIILGAASGAAAVVGAGSAGLLPPAAQVAFDQVVSVVVPPGVVGQETNDQGEVPGTSTGPSTTKGNTDDTVVSPDPAESDDVESDDDVSTDSTSGTSGSNNGNSGEGNSGKGNGNGGSDSTDTTPGNSGSSNGTSGEDESEKGNSGNGNSENSNSGSGKSDNGNSGKDDSENGNSGKSDSENGSSKKP